MSEAIIIGVVQQLENFLVETPSIDTDHDQILKEVITELRMMMDFLRYEKSGERRRNYLLADFAEMAQQSADLIRDIGKYYFLKEITNVLDCLRKTKKRMMEFGVVEGVARPQSVGEEGDEGVLVGLEKDVQQLVGKAILHGGSRLNTSCIKGMVGVGKTTLARQVYNHPAIIGNFQRRAWVTISSDMSMHEVLVELVQQLVKLGGDSPSLEEMDNRSLEEMLSRRLHRMWSYFIVLDNVPQEVQNLYFLMRCVQGTGSRLLLTSRFELPIPFLHNTHEMKALDSDKSWKLFLKTIFRGDEFKSDEHKFPKDLEWKGREMLKKCGGLPLAIIDVARQKAKERLSGIEWEQLFDSIDLSESLKLLEPMYHDLDEELKACFLHMSFFKENALMREEKLEQIWAATGLNTGRYTTHNLYSQSIIEVIHPYPRIGEVTRCRINPLLHRLSIIKAEEKMGLEILRSNGSNRLSQSPRHRVIHCDREKFSHSTNQEEQLASLIFHGGGRYLDDASQSYWESFEFLKILDMEDFGVKTLPDSIGTLSELKYLGLRNNYIQEIPHSLGGLKRLDVLDIAQNFMVEVPDIFKEMDSLRHLYMSDVISRKSLKVDALQNLETLTYISIYDWTYEITGLEMMTRLLKFGIEEVDENSDIGKLFASLARLESLECLTSRGFRFRSMPCLDEIGVLYGLRELRLDGRLSKLPNFPRCIRHLVLVDTCLDEDPMPVLQKMPDLEVLKLRNAYTGRKMQIAEKEDSFSKLRVLRMNELWNLTNVQVEKGAMFQLMQLEIKNCPHLETLPREIGSMRYLREFKMVTTKHIATKIRNSGLISKIVEVVITP